MGRELPIFEPAAGHGHDVASLSIAIGGGPVEGTAAGTAGSAARRHPDWIRSRLPSGDNYHDLKGLLRGLNLNTVCEEARCPNIGECWDQRTATVMILGDTCTRACGFCAIKTGKPTWFDDDEPRRVAEAVAAMHLEHVVVTSVARDDLPDGGAGAFAATIREL
jgi:lipoyl synthase